MKLTSQDYPRIIQQYEALRLKLGRETPSFKTLVKHDPSGLFTELHKRAVGLKFTMAIRALKNNAFCIHCKKNLPQSLLCNVCLRNPEAVAKAKAVHASNFSATWRAKSKEEIASITKRRKLGCLQTLGVEHPAQSEAIQSRMRATCKQNFGFENPSHSDAVRTKRRRTTFKNFGCEQPFHSEEVRAKVRSTLENRYGVENAMQIPASIKKCTASWQARYDGGHPLRDASVMRRLRATCKVRYGSHHPMHNKEIFEKVQRSGIRSRDFVFQGKTLRLQGYEPQVLAALNANLEVSNVEDSMKAISYEFQGNSHRYYPDFQANINGVTCLFEVKSTYTLQYALDSNLAKFRAANRLCRKEGKKFVLAVHLPKDNRTICINFPTKEKIVNQISSFSA